MIPFEMNMPLVNLQRQYQSIKKDIDAAITSVCEKGNFILGEEVETFENEFAKYVGTKYCVGVASGTDAIKIMAQTASIQKGDEIIVQANTFIATVLPFIELGAKPVFVDCDETTGAIDVDQVQKAITKRTRAILPVHLFGLPAPMKKLKNLLSSNALSSKLLLLEDAAQAHGSSIGNKKAGSFGHMAAFSFYPGKNLGAYGDGGAITTNNKRFANAIRIIRNIGQKKKYDHVRLGVNSRLDTMQAAVLRVKLKHLDAWNKKRKIIALRYLRRLSNLGDLILPSSESTTNWHLFVIQTKKRDALAKFLEKNGIHTGIHYPVPLHLTPALKFLGYKKGDFPVAEARAKTMLTLPVYAELTKKEVEYIVRTIKQFFR